jgi:hypothetical protein
VQTSHKTHQHRWKAFAWPEERQWLPIPRHRAEVGAVVSLEFRRNFSSRTVRGRPELDSSLKHRSKSGGRLLKVIADGEILLI